MGRDDEEGRGSCSTPSSLFSLVCHSLNPIVVEWAKQGLHGLLRVEKHRLQGGQVEDSEIEKENKREEEGEERQGSKMDRPRETVVGEPEDLLHDFFLNLGALPLASAFDVKGGSPALPDRSSFRKKGKEEERKEEKWARGEGRGRAPRMTLSKRLGHVLDTVLFSASLAWTFSSSSSTMAPSLCMPMGKEERLLRISRGMLLLMRLRMDPISESHLSSIQKIASLWAAQARELDGMGWVVEWVQSHLLLSCMGIDMDDEIGWKSGDMEGEEIGKAEEEKGERSRGIRIRVYAMVLDVLSPYSPVSSLMRQLFSWKGLEEEGWDYGMRNPGHGKYPLKDKPARAYGPSSPSEIKDMYDWVEMHLKDMLERHVTDDVDYLMFEAVIRLVDGIIIPYYRMPDGGITQVKKEEEKEEEGKERMMTFGEEWTVDVYCSYLGRMIGLLRQLDGSIRK